MKSLASATVRKMNRICGRHAEFSAKVSGTCQEFSDCGSCGAKPDAGFLLSVVVDCSDKDVLVALRLPSLRVHLAEEIWISKRFCLCSLGQRWRWSRLGLRGSLRLQHCEEAEEEKFGNSECYDVDQVEICL